MFTVTVLGSSGSHPAPDNPASGYLVRTPGTALVLDLGSGSLMRLLGVVAPTSIDALVISHVHPDHCSDLFSFFVARMRHGAELEPLPVYVPEGAADHFIRFARAEDADHPFRQMMQFHTVSQGDVAHVGKIELQFANTIHPVPTLATRVTIGAASLVYSGDTGPSAELAELAAGADVLLCEAAMVGDRDDATYPFHLTAGEAGTLAAEAGVGRLILTHVPPSLSPATSFDEATAQFRGPVEVAAAGMEITIGAR